MLLDTIVIVLRETLEAGVLVSVLLSMGNQRAMGITWLWAGFVLGGIGAVFYAVNLGNISEWFDYVGQEVVNASIQYVIYLCLLVICLLASDTARSNTFTLKLCMALAVTLAIVREGAEVMILFSGFLSNEGVLLKAITSGFVGLMVGVSVGALCYYAIMASKAALASRIQILMLILVAGGMVAQATQLFIQADWLPAMMPLWDSNWLLSEHSIAGQIAYAVFGYEATPSVLEVSLYLVALMLIPILQLLLRGTIFDIRAR